MKKRKYIIFFLIPFIIIWFVCVSQDNKIIFINANPEKGFNYGYYYYIPKNIKKTSKIYILVEPNNTGFTSDDNEVHKQSAKEMIIRSTKGLADELGCVLLVPVFDRPKSNDLMYTHALDRDTILNDAGMSARIDLQLIRMVDDFKVLLKSKGLDVEQKILIDGFSASGTFANRFTALHPDMIRAVASGGINSMPILPLKEREGTNLIYPIGLYDIEAITGEKFDFDTYATIPQFIYMGSKDDNDTLTFDDAFGTNERDIIINVLGLEMQKRWEKSKKIYTELGYFAEFTLYNDVGHEITNDIMDDIVEFFLINMKE